MELGMLFPHKQNNLVVDDWLYILPEKSIAYIVVESNCLLLEIGCRVLVQKATIFCPPQIHQNNTNI